MATLHLKVLNQPGSGEDRTEEYIRAAEWTPPRSVSLQGVYLEGDDEEAVFQAFQSLSLAVRWGGHLDGSTNEVFLSACPDHLRSPGWTGERLLRVTCHEFDSYKEWADTVQRITGLFITRFNDGWVCEVYDWDSDMMDCESVDLPTDRNPTREEMIKQLQEIAGSYGVAEEDFDEGDVEFEGDYEFEDDVESEDDVEWASWRR